MPVPHIEINEKHEYFIDNIPAVGVNELLKEFGIGVDFDALPPAVQANFETARVRGNYLHTMAALYLQGKLNEKTLDIQLQPYLVGVKKLLAENKVEPLAIEERIGFKTLLIAGTPDLICKFNDILAVVDWKFVKSLRKYYELLTGGYQYIYNQNKKPEEMVKQGIIAHIFPGGYKIEVIGFDCAEEFGNLLISHHVIKKYKEV